MKSGQIEHGDLVDKVDLSTGLSTQHVSGYPTSR